MSLKGFEWLRKEVTQDKIEIVRQLEPVAKDLGCSMAQLALAWCLTNPNVSTVITGATRAEQVRENMKSLDVVPKLTPQVMERIEAVLANKPVLEEE
jgi:aryl-alcohol dehydrogenase-like predicted oxidoreductase